MKTFGIINLGFIGDVVNSSPVSTSLKQKYPRSKIVYITINASKETAKLLPYVDKVYVYDRKKEHKGLWGQIKAAVYIKEKEKFDCLIILDNSFRAALFAFILGAKYRIGRAGQGRSFILTHKVPFKKEEQLGQTHISEHYMRILQPLGAYGQNYKLDIKSKPEKNNFIENILNQTKNENKKLIGLCPCGRDEFKDWPIKEVYKFIKTINYQENKKIVIIGDKRTSSYLRPLYKQGIKDFIDLSSKTNISELVYLISNLECLVSVDTGPMHIGFALDTPTICLFYYDIVKKWGPKNSIKHKVIFKNKSEITSELVYNEMESLLNDELI